VNDGQYAGNVVALAGGVGGAKLAEGLAQVLSPEQLTVVVNTGDDFEHLGLAICPDLDTVLYTLAGVANAETGWGRAEETFHCLETVAALGGPDWFRLGDRDLATHLLRTQWLAEGLRLTEVTQRLCAALDVRVSLLPMTDAPFRTHVLTDEGELSFQDYFVRRRWQPVLQGVRWHDPEDAEPTPEVRAALEGADVVILCPSNPFVSIDPILALPGVRALLAAPLVVAVSPILGGDVVKGPAAKMFRELGSEPTAAAVAEHYDDLLDGFVLDAVDAAQAEAVRALGMTPLVAPTLMTDAATRRRVADEVLSFAETLR
jgi:LPPG:FO 2-phospho-L-lactate transferase